MNQEGAGRRCLKPLEVLRRPVPKAHSHHSRGEGIGYLVWVSGGVAHGQLVFFCGKFRENHLRLEVER